MWGSDRNTDERPRRSRSAMQSDTFERAKRLREITEVDREISRELCETAKTTRAECEELIRRSRSRVSRERPVIRGLAIGVPRLPRARSSDAPSAGALSFAPVLTRRAGVIAPTFAAPAARGSTPPWPANTASAPTP
jgi:hypothetical protein